MHFMHRFGSIAVANLHTSILDNLSAAIVLVDTRLHVTYLNPSAEALLEASGMRVLGEPLGRVLRDRGDPTLEQVKEVVRSGTPFTKRQATLFLISTHDITVDYAVTPFQDEDGQLQLIVELHPLDRLLRISREDAIISSQQRTRALIRGMAHEIKNPLGGLRGAAQLLARELPDDSLQDYTSIIIEEADRLRDLVDRMLGPHKPPERKPLNIHEVLEYVRNLSEAETGTRIAFSRDYDPSIPDLCGDRQQLIQAVLNIVRNAMQALVESDAPAPRITLRTRALRQFTIGGTRHRLVCRVDVVDNGPGIPPGLQESIFFPMVSGRAEGTGLGLSISQSIINQHHGLVECVSEPGHTRFSLYLPLESSNG